MRNPESLSVLEPSCAFWALLHSVELSWHWCLLICARDSLLRIWVKYLFKVLVSVFIDINTALLLWFSYGKVFFLNATSTSSGSLRDGCGVVVKDEVHFSFGQCHGVDENTSCKIVWMWIKLEWLKKKLTVYDAGLFQSRFCIFFMNGICKSSRLKRVHLSVFAIVRQCCTYLTSTYTGRQMNWSEWESKYETQVAVSYT